MAEEFEEEEVWAALMERKDASPRGRRGKASCHASSSTATRRDSSSSARMIPRSNASSETGGSALRQTAPVSIPGYSNTYKHAGDGGNEEDEEDEDDNRAPPHEWLAKKMARSQISSSSVCEGAGRTLKGRDLSKVRNAVLTKTGFLE